MHPCRCVVAFTDSRRVDHQAEVWASSVYGAVAQAVREFRGGGIAEELPDALTEFSIVVHRQPVTHRLKLQQVTQWAEGGGTSPRDAMERHEIRRLLQKESKA